MSQEVPELYGLLDSEKWWSERFSLLESHGYRLRKRLRPGWIPSWKTNPRLRPIDCDDSAYNSHPHVTHAIRISDGLDVINKKVSKDGNEASIGLFLSSEEGEENHCIPIFDQFDDDKEQDVEFIVMPLLRRFNNPPFYRVNEVVDFIRQTLQGIAFIHSKNVAHRDCSDLNIMLDGTALYPDGFHPIRQSFKRARPRMARYKNRSDVQGVKYYFTDFGISSRFDSSEQDRLVTGCACQAYVPELSDTIPYDPFAVDIYLLGDVYKRHFIEKFDNLQFLRPLAENMTQKKPKDRPNAVDAMNLLEDIVTQRSGHSLRWRLIAANSSRLSRMILNIGCTSREAVLAVLWPTRELSKRCQ